MSPALTYGQEYIDAANDFASERHAPANFVLACGERLPFSAGSFDAVLSFDVLEHVQNVHRTLAECHRVLKPGGMLFVVFPGYYQPIEHHLSMVSRTPCLHWFFSGRTLVRAYYEVLAERGEDAAWYRRESAYLEPWERGHIINGTTFALFARMIRQGDWVVVHRAMKPIGSVGRVTARRAWAKGLSRLLVPLVHVPGLQELLLHRITYILCKHA